VLAPAVGASGARNPLLAAREPAMRGRLLVSPVSDLPELPRGAEGQQDLQAFRPGRPASGEESLRCDSPSWRPDRPCAVLSVSDHMGLSYRGTRRLSGRAWPAAEPGTSPAWAGGRWKAWT